ncbi:MAG: ATP-binding protein [Roseovarius sp.]
MAGQPARLKKLFKLREYPIAVVLTVTLVLTLTALVGTRVNSHLLESARQAALDEANKDADAIAGALQRELVQVDVIARAVRYAVERSTDMDEGEYADLVASLIGNSPSIISIALSKGYVVERIYPLKGHEKAIGMDYRERPERIAVVNEVLRSGQPSLAGPLMLTRGEIAFIHRTPYYNDGRNERGRVASGIVSVLVERDELLSRIALDHGIGTFEAAIRKVDAGLVPLQTLYGRGGVFAQNPVLRQIPTDGGMWQIGLVPSSGWPTRSGSAGLVWALSFLGSSILGAMMFALWSMYRGKQTAEGQLRSALNSIDDAFALYDEQDRLVFFNEKYLAYYDLSRDAIFAGNTFENILREGLRNGQYKDAVGNEEEWLRERLAKHFNPTAPIEQKLGDGRWLKVAETRSPEGNTVGFRVDITELKLAREKAEAANQAKNNFLNIISHELRTPLTSVIGYARFLENLEVLPGFKALDRAICDKAPESERKRALEALRNDVSTMSGRITNSSDHLLGLINDVLDRAKLEAQTVELCEEEVDLGDIVKSVASGLGIKAAEKGIDLTTDVAPLPLVADAKRLRQALINVVGNAIKFTETGGVHVSSDQDDAQVSITITDTGCGIPPADLEKIFQQFVQVDTSVTRRNSGTGLGLAITRELIQLHGGSITVESALDQGSVFTITLPIKDRSMDLAA